MSGGPVTLRKGRWGSEGTHGHRNWPPRSPAGGSDSDRRPGERRVEETVRTRAVRKTGLA